LSNKWWKNSVIYQIFPRSFKDSNGDGIGDIQGIISKLDYLKELGINAIWLCPIYQSPNKDSGYDVSDYYSIWNDIGTMEDFNQLIEEIHKRDMKLIMELVANHSSDEHKWFLKSRMSKDNPYRDYYIWKPGKNNNEPNNWMSTKVGGSAWEYDTVTGEYYLHIYSKNQPDFNWENPKLRKAIYDIMNFWFNKGVDGFRMDVINKIAKEEGLPDVKKEDNRKYLPAEEYFQNHPKVHKYLKEMNEEVLSKYDNIVTIGQTQGVTLEQALLYTAEDRKELSMFLQFEHVNFDINGSKKLDFELIEFKRIINKWQSGLGGKVWNTIFFGSHDLPRAVSHFGNDKEYRVESAKMIGAILLSLRGTPIIYQGDEIGMTNTKFHNIDDYRDIRTINTYKERVVSGGESIESFMKDIWQVSRDNARTPMQWNSNKNAGFTDVTPWIKVNSNYKQVNVENELKDSSSIVNFYKKLISLRKQHKSIIDGEFKLILEDDPKIFAYIRENKCEKILIVANFSVDSILFNIPEDIGLNHINILLSNYNINEKFKEATYKLRPYEVIVISLK
jgi:oligo-1,6-glucosidase